MVSCMGVAPPIAPSSLIAFSSASASDRFSLRRVVRVAGETGDLTFDSAFAGATVRCFVTEGAGEIVSNGSGDSCTLRNKCAPEGVPESRRARGVLRIPFPFVRVAGVVNRPTEEATVLTEEEELRRVRWEMRGREGFELGRDFDVGSLVSRQSGELLRSPFSRDFFVGGARPSAGSSGARRTKRREDRDRRAIVESSVHCVVDSGFPFQGLTGIGGLSTE